MLGRQRRSGSAVHVVVVGLMGVGKTTAARGIAAALGRPLRDSDADVEALLGVTGAALAAQGRVDDLHAMEEAVLLGALALDEPHVVAAAAWVVESPLCRGALARRATVVHLDLPVEQLRQRIAAGDHRRPIPSDELHAIAERRRPLFDEVADVRIDATLDPEQVVSVALDAIAASVPGSAA